MTEKNIFITTLSTINRINKNYYYYTDSTNTKKYCCGECSNEAGAKYILSTEDIYEIIILGSDEVFCDSDKNTVNSQKSINNVRTDVFQKKYNTDSIKGHELLFFLERLAKFIKSSHDDIKAEIYERFSENTNCMIPKPNNRDTKVRFIPLQKGKSVNLSTIVEEIRPENDDHINIFMDVQGGSRTDSFVLNAVLSILENNNHDNISISKIIATKYEQGNEANQIVDETSRYRISELVAGMNSFVRYGKADAISEFLDNIVSDNDNLKELSRCMIQIDEAVSLCNTAALKDRIADLKVCLTKELDKSIDVSEIFNIIKNEIEHDYGKLLSLNHLGDIDIIELIRWCARKNFIHQALVILETEIPQRMAEDKMIECREEDIRLLEEYCMDGCQELNLGNTRSTENIYHYLIKTYSSHVNKTDDKFFVKPSERYSCDFHLYRHKLSNICHEIYGDSPYGNIHIYSSLKKNEMSDLLERYYVLSLRRNEISHSADDRPTQWDIRRIKEELLNFTDLYNNLYKNNIQQTALSSPKATDADLLNLKSVFENRTL